MSDKRRKVADEERPICTPVAVMVCTDAATLAKRKRFNICNQKIPMCCRQCSRRSSCSFACKEDERVKQMMIPETA